MCFENVWSGYTPHSGLWSVVCEIDSTNRWLAESPKKSGLVSCQSESGLSRQARGPLRQRVGPEGKLGVGFEALLPIWAGL